MKEKILRRPGLYLIASFCLGALAYYLYLSYSQLTGGKYVVLMSDALEGYIPGLRWFYNSLLNGKNISYSWSGYLGINNYISISGMLLFSVSAPVYLLLHNFDYAFATVIVLVLKSGLTSMFFSFYVHKIWKVRKENSVVFGILYAMCGFQVSYIPILLHFSDAIFMLPIILYLVSEYAEKGKIRNMCLAYIYLFLNFYYTGYIVGFFSLFYLILDMFFLKKYTIKTIIKKLLLFGACIIISAGILMIILYPTAYFIFTKYSEDATKLSDFGGVYLHDLYNQMFVGQCAGIRSQYPYIYCGLLTLILAPFYFFNHNINKDEKKIFFSLIVIIVISCFVPALYLFWHCFDAPDSFAYRFSFIISFLLCVVASIQSQFLNQINKKALCLCVFANILIYIICMNIQPVLQTEYNTYPKNTLLYLLINSGFLILYLLWVILYKTKKNRENEKSFFLILVLVIITETVVNGYSNFYKSEDLNPSNYSDVYYIWENSMTDAVDTIAHDAEGFYRVDYENDYIINGATFFGYNGISTFSNMENYEVRIVLEKLGLETSPRTVLSNGLTDFTKMILDVEYTINGIDFENRKEQFSVDNSSYVNVYRVEPHLSIGFLVEDGIKEFEFSSNNQFENINDLANCFTEGEDVLYELYDGLPLLEERGISIANDGVVTRYYLNPMTGINSGSLLISIPAKKNPAFVVFDYGASTIDYSAPFFYNPGTGEYRFRDRITAKCIIPMAHIQDRNYIAIFMDEGLYNNIYAPNNMYFAYYNNEAIWNVYDKLKDGQMEEIDYGNGYVLGHIDVDEDNKVLFTSIPYDEGWEIKVNGMNTEPLQLLDGAFIGLELPKGSYDIEFKYHVPGLKTGAIITIVSLILMMILLTVDPQIKTVVRTEKIKKKKETDIAAESEYISEEKEN